MEHAKTITVKTTVGLPVDKVWDYWRLPEHIVGWNNASDDWHTPRAENDLTPGGKFFIRMEARDGSAGFDFTGVYDKVDRHRLISYRMDDGRKVQVRFSGDGDRTSITETFEAEDTHTPEMQQAGWQAILDNFAKYAASRK
jgi:uncharacterized protein YndB with AHSA1/START domain